MCHPTARLPVRGSAGRPGQGLVQLTPLGAVAPFPVAVNPNVVEAFAPSVPLYAALRTDTEPEVPVLTPFQRLLMAWPEARVRRTVQPLSVVAPLLATVTSAW